MAKETKTVQCYPSDSKINETCARYGSFGWELIGNQRCEEDKGTYDGYRHWTTFNKLTFTREKTSPWYDEVTDLERDYEKMEKERDRYKNLEPDEPGTSSKFGWFFTLIAIIFIVAGALNIGLSFMTPGYNFGLYLGLGFVVIGLLRFIGKVLINKSKKKKYQAAHDSWRESYSSKISAIEKDMKELLEKSDNIVNA